MAWTAPPTFVAGNALTAAQLNILAADLNETAPAKATAAGRLLVTTGANAIAERVPTTASVLTNESTSSTAYVDLATPGPTITATTGTRAIVMVNCGLQSSSTSNNVYSTYSVNGASLTSDSNSLVYAASSTTTTFRASTTVLDTSLTAGSNVFTQKYRVSAATASFLWRTLVVIPL